MKTRLRRSECVRVHVLSSLRTRASMYVFESLSTLAFDFEPEKGIMECAESTGEFLPPPPPLPSFVSREGEFITGLLLLFIAYLSIFNLIIEKKLATEYLRGTEIFSFPPYFPEKNFHSLIDPRNIYIYIIIIFQTLFNLPSQKAS